jgi:hypothetical protein
MGAVASTSEEQDDPIFTTVIKHDGEGEGSETESITQEKAGKASMS